MPKKLTDKQQNFARAIAKGHSYADAYREAYDCERMSPRSIQVESWKLAQNPAVTLMVERLRQAIDAGTVASTVGDRERILRRLRVLLDDPQGTQAEQISLKAAHLLGQTLGLYSKRVEVDDRRDRSPDEIRQELEARLAEALGNPEAPTDTSVH